jgi:hypothetical protein
MKLFSTLCLLLICSECLWGEISLLGTTPSDYNNPCNGTNSVSPFRIHVYDQAQGTFAGQELYPT